MSVTKQSFMREFESPTPFYRTMPFWVWNSDFSKDEIRAQLLELKEHGFGGAFVHPRPGLISEYMSQEWFSEWDCALQTAKELDLTLGLYDENSYPSGFGGGHVPAMCPQCLSQSIGFKRVNIAEAKARHSRMLDRPMKIFAFQSEKGSIIKDVTLLPANEWGRYSHEFLIITC
ncbi:MAG: hypothetical protein ACLR23_18340 [Clostridia bacterium]